MGSIVVMIAVNAISFFIISRILSGFEIKDGKTALIVSVIYSIFAYITSLLVLPLVAIVSMGLALIAFIPLIGKFIAGAGLFITTFLVSFIMSAILLIIVDKMIDDFKMSSTSTALAASLLLALLNVGIRVVTPFI